MTLKLVEPTPEPQLIPTSRGCDCKHRPCYRLLSDYFYVDETTFDEPVVIFVPAGFHCDLASVPRLVRPLIEPYELSIIGPFIHDVLYRYAGQLPKGWLLPDEPPRAYTLRQTDALLKRIMDQEGIPEWRGTVAWLGVRAGGWWSWRKAKRRWRVS